MQIILVPRETGVGVTSGKKFYEMTEMRDTNGFPFALVVTDVFHWNDGDNAVCEALENGTPIVVDVTLFAEYEDLHRKT